ncbi:MAG: peptidyl-prolyl cis-trans isomerase [Gemmataceae bacterium]|nr:peptidyl-prolyl cis-trans isomerase [Gemmataceae bacterium]
MDTSHGKIAIELFADKAPITTKNFLQYVDDKFYDGLIFHRVIADFMIQGGGLEPGLKKKDTRPPIKNEAGNGLSNERGAIAMARLGALDDTPEEIQKAADSATSQFFINVKDNNRLDRARAADKVGYTVFGRVIDGMDVVDRIRRVETASRGGHKDVPVQDVVIRSVRRK